MSNFEELEKRLEESRNRIDELVQSLEQHVGLQESLRTVSGGLEAANTRVESLAASAGVANESLAEVLTSLQEAVAILRESDPARATEAIAGVVEKLNNAEQRIIEAVNESVSAVSNEQKNGFQLASETVSGLEDKLTGTEQRVIETINETASAITGEQEKGFQQALEAVSGIADKLTGTEQRVIETISEAASAISSEQEQSLQQVTEELSVIKKSVPTKVAYVTLALVLIMLGFEIVSLFPALLPG